MMRLESKIKRQQFHAKTHKESKHAKFFAALLPYASLREIKKKSPIIGYEPKS